ncbi:MAG: AmmeMemoRadiSam system radical SAM enzyme [Dehalococcoidales bacterium]|nr:MAG: AmmeMemoRadiSam system radical SAM enzyme [Dehalococcoidales bacterium]
MLEKSTSNDGWNRRAFLKASAGAVCALWLAGILGCTREQNSVGTSPLQTAQKGFVRSAPSPWFSKLDNTKVRCELCPKRCELEEGERAPCRVRTNRDGVMYTLAYDNPTLILEDPVERVPFYHVIPGTRTLSVATAGCNLQCKFCEAWDMTQVTPEEVHAHDMPPETVVAHAVKANVQSISYAYGEPVIFYEYMAVIAALAKEERLLNLLHTAGYIQIEPLIELTGKLDAVNVDLKSFDPTFYKEVVGGELDPVLRTLKILRDAGVHIEITNIIIPTLNDDMKKITQMCEWIVNELGSNVPIHFVRFYPLYKLSDLPRTPVSTLDKARNIALDEGLKFVYISRITGHEGENTFCPGCGKILVKRVGFVIDEINLENGKCKYCGTDIPGIWA